MPQWEDGGARVATTPAGKVASFYYLKYTTMAHLQRSFSGRDLGVDEVLEVGSWGEAARQLAGSWAAVAYWEHCGNK